jgi:hypothetical protein
MIGASRHLSQFSACEWRASVADRGTVPRGKGCRAVGYHGGNVAYGVSAMPIGVLMYFNAKSIPVPAEVSVRPGDGKPTPIEDWLWTDATS